MLVYKSWGPEPRYLYINIKAVPLVGLDSLWSSSLCSEGVARVPLLVLIHLIFQVGLHCAPPRNPFEPLLNPEPPQKMFWIVFGLFSSLMFVSSMFLLSSVTSRSRALAAGARYIQLSDHHRGLC